MTNQTEHFNPSQQTTPTNPAEKKRWPFFLLDAADVIRAVSLLIGSGFFTLILLLGLDIAMHMLTGGLIVLGFALFMAILISALVYYMNILITHFKEKILEQALPLASPADLTLQAQMQKLLKVLIALEEELKTKGKNTQTGVHPDDHSSGN